jgi:hypothetical protein
MCGVSPALKRRAIVGGPYGTGCESSFVMIADSEDEGAVGGFERWNQGLRLGVG